MLCTEAEVTGAALMISAPPLALPGQVYEVTVRTGGGSEVFRRPGDIPLKVPRLPACYHGGWLI
jgi:hypothetical protein